MTADRCDPRATRVWPLAARHSKHAIADIRLDPDAAPPPPGAAAPLIDRTAAAIRAARARQAAVILVYGAHLVKNGAGPLVARLARDGWVTHLATHGAGVIHDWEYAFLGRSEEDVRAHVAAGCFGTWHETGHYLHLAAVAGAAAGVGFGAALGRFIVEEGYVLPERAQLAAAVARWAAAPADDPRLPAQAELLQFMLAAGLEGGAVRVPHPYADFSLTGAAYRLRVPLTVHPGIGYDIIWTHPHASGAGIGRAAHLDFLTLCHSAGGLEDGAVISVGSAVMAPQVLEKALSVANNHRRQRGLGPVRPFVAVNDLAAAAWDWSHGEPPPDDPAYYLRFCKSFSRVASEVVYVRLDNRVFLHNLLHALR